MIHPFSFLNYIDPGTGSMLVTVILGVVTAGVFLVRGLFIRMKVRLSGGHIKEDADKIPYVIFSDHKRYWNVFEPICDEFESRGISCTYYTASSDDPALSKEYSHVKCEFIGEGNKGFAHLNMMKAYVCLSTTPGLDVLQWKRSKDVSWYAHIFHELSDGLLYRMFALDHYDAVLATGDIQEHAVRTLEEMRHLPAKEICIVGSTYLDRLYRRYQEYDIPAKKDNSDITVLLAPTWGGSGILKRFGRDFIQALVETGYRIIIRPHPQSKVSEKDMLDELEKEFPENDRLSWNYDNDNFRVLSEADIMISDYSGVIFDYAFIFDKPVICTDTDFDASPYDAAWTDGQTWSFGALPKMGRRLTRDDFPFVKDIIDETMNSEEYRTARAALRDEAWHFRGQSAVRTVDYMISKYEELTGQQKKD